MNNVEYDVDLKRALYDGLSLKDLTKSVTQNEHGAHRMYRTYVCDVQV